MTTSMALGPSATGKPLYLFGWPFPVPPLDGEDDEAEVNAATAEGRYSTDAFAQWRDVMATAVTAEKATRVFPVSEWVGECVLARVGTVAAAGSCGGGAAAAGVAAARSAASSPGAHTRAPRTPPPRAAVPQ